MLSKYCENSIVCRKLVLLTQSGVSHTDTNVTVIHMFDYKDCDIWFMRFSMDFWQRILALGNQVGHTYVWDMAITYPTHSRKASRGIKASRPSPTPPTRAAPCSAARSA